jgi:hypothetical protein
MLQAQVNSSNVSQYTMPWINSKNLTIDLILIVHQACDYDFSVKCLDAFLGTMSDK